MNGRIFFFAAIMRGGTGAGADAAPAGKAAGERLIISRKATGK